MANKCMKCGSTENYNFALNIGLCNICISKELERIYVIENTLVEITNIKINPNFSGVQKVGYLLMLISDIKEMARQALKGGE